MANWLLHRSASKTVGLLALALDLHVNVRRQQFCHARQQVAGAHRQHLVIIAPGGPGRRSGGAMISAQRPGRPGRRGHVLARMARPSARLAFALGQCAPAPGPVCVDAMRPPPSNSRSRPALARVSSARSMVSVEARWHRACCAAPPRSWAASLVMRCLMWRRIVVVLRRHHARAMVLQHRALLVDEHDVCEAEFSRNRPAGFLQEAAGRHRDATLKPDAYAFASVPGQQAPHRRRQIFAQRLQQSSGHSSPSSVAGPQGSDRLQSRR